VLLEERGVLFSGDPMVNFDYATGERGVKLHRFNEDRDGAMASLERLRRTVSGKSAPPSPLKGKAEKCGFFAPRDGGRPRATSPLLGRAR
jgi:hypothetical protein